MRIDSPAQPEVGITISIGIIAGGALPAAATDMAKAGIDIRAFELSDLKRVSAENIATFARLADDRRSYTPNRGPVVAEAGLPVLDGLGPIGGLDHGPDEYILKSSIVPRTALLAELIRLICGANNG